MGVVYKARDTRLGRDVAIKVLPPVFARDPDRLARFEREARAVAAINHPNIVSVHDIGSADVVDDEQGRDARGLPDHGAPRRRHAARAAGAGTADGAQERRRRDAGRARPGRRARPRHRPSRSEAREHRAAARRPREDPRLRPGQAVGASRRTDDQQTMAATDAGTVLGTVGYMAPEQVRGEAVDPRSDLFALGAVLYELASGRRAVRAADGRRDDDRDSSRRSAGADRDASRARPALDRIVRHALEKDPDDRFQSARDFAFALQAVNDATSSGAEHRADCRARSRRAAPCAGANSRPGSPRPSSPSSPRRPIAWPRARGSAAAARRSSFSPTLPWRDAVLASPAVSPDGRRIAFIARGASATRSSCAAWTRCRRSRSRARRARDRRALLVAGRTVARLLRRRQAQDDRARHRTRSTSWPTRRRRTAARGDATARSSSLPDERSPIFRVSARRRRGDARDDARSGAPDEAHRWPQFLPDGRHFVFMPWTAGTVTRKIQLASLDGGPSTTLFESESAAIVAGNYFSTCGICRSRLMAQAFNPATFASSRAVAIVVTTTTSTLQWHDRRSAWRRRRRRR